MPTTFRVTEHTIDGQHLREYPGSIVDQSLPAKISVKQYTPIDNVSPQPGDVTIIVAHGNGLVKEAYEPLFETLLLLSRKSTWKIRNIWAAEAAHQGTSAILNADNLGNDPNCFDFSRDLLHLVNVFRKDMIRPIYGIGHSMGATSLIHMSNMHSNLFSSLVIIEPSVSVEGTPEYNKILKALISKPDHWSSMEQALTHIKTSARYKNWDPRALDRLIRYGLRPISADQTNGPVAFVTTRKQELLSIGRPNFQDAGKDAKSFSVAERETYPDLDPTALRRYPFYKPEPRMAAALVPTLRPRTLFLHGTESRFLSQEQIDFFTQNAGTGPGGSGGHALGQVETVYVRGGHFVPLERGGVEGTAERIANFFESVTENWKAAERRRAALGGLRDPQRLKQMDEDIAEHVKQLPPRPKL